MTNENNDQQMEPLLENQEELNENKHYPLAFYVTLCLLILVVIAGGFAGYLCYPFTAKIEGHWASTDETLKLRSTGRSWELTIPNYQQNKGLSLLYAGTWKAAGINTYEGDQVKLLMKINKADFSKEELDELEKKSDLYIVSKQTDKELTLQYTQKGIQKIQSQPDLNKVVHVTLENIHWDKKQEKLFLNSSYFSNERIEFAYVK
ncbi:MULTISPECIES: hypothetical protein [unclassified Enterococcus]|uniref:hypothetical protein n=1 Tax=unclassified Enterococcus TaxID=2608891 RepID=UPI001CE09695|nr:MULTISPECIES: hypothetical protein [unclassified Enterococcus]MCA5014495.1 hypothetical protein [Enterococcus sp. S23]MCA5017391.1 hypothetical protein [Enterococcus sp. S22(2020)]